MTTSLSAGQIARYGEDGYLFPLQVMDEVEAAGYRQRVEALERHYAADGLPRPIGSYLRANAHYVSPLIAELATLPAILDAVEGILGPDLMIWSSDLFIKEPASPKIVSWHQDLTYWGLGATDLQVTAWLALSPVTRASGCMRFVAGSHRNDIVPHNDTFDENNLLSRGQEIAVEVDENEAVDVVLAPGQISLHHGRMFHASGPNVSADRRIGMAIRFVTPEVRQLVGERDYAMLVRGIDDRHNFVNVARPSHDFAADSLERYERIIADKAVALGQGAKKAMNPALSAARM